MSASHADGRSEGVLLAGLAFAMGLAVAALLAVPFVPPAPRGARSVTDAAGTRVALPRTIGRAVPLFPPSIDDFLVVTRRPDAVVAMADVNRPALATGVLGRMFPEVVGRAATVRSGGAGANVEALLLARPDLVIAATGAAPVFRRAGLATLAVTNTGDERYAIDAARVAAEGMGEPGRQPVLLARYRSKLAALADALAPYSHGPRPRVLMLYELQGRLFALGTGTLQTLLVGAAGGRNAVAGRGPVRLDRERLLRLDPDVIVVMNTSPPSITPDALMRDPVWAGLASVRSRRVYRAITGLQFFPSGLVGMPLYARWLAELLHPALPPALRRQTADAYVEATGYRLGDADLDVALSLAGNRRAAGYERFARQ